VYEHSKVDFEFEVEPDVPLREVVRDLLGEVIARWRAAWCAIGDAAGAEREAAFERWRREDARLRRVFDLIGADFRDFYEREKHNIAVLRRLHNDAARRWAGVVADCEGCGRFRALWTDRR